MDHVYNDLHTKLRIISVPSLATDPLVVFGAVDEPHASCIIGV